MKTSLKYCVDIQKMCDAPGRLHVYFIDANGVILTCNKSKADFFRDIFGCVEVIGKKYDDIFGRNNFFPSELCHSEMLEILKSGFPHQAYQVHSIKDKYRLDLLTFKTAIYDMSGKPLGILVTSQVLNRFSIKTSYSLGLTKRETECLFYLYEGLTAKEMAKLIKLSPRTVEGYIDNMRTRLNCSTTSELLLKASQSQVRISFDDEAELNVISPFSQNIS